MKNKDPEVKTPREMFIEEEHKKFKNWCRNNDWDFCSLELRAAWVCWLGRAEKDFEYYLAAGGKYAINNMVSV